MNHHCGNTVGAACHFFCCRRHLSCKQGWNSWQTQIPSWTKKKKKEEKIVSPWSRCLVFLLFIINMNITYTCICVYICIYKCKHIWTYIIHTNTYIYNLLYIYKLLNHIYYRKCVSFGVGNNQIILVTQTKAEKEHAAIKMRVVSAKKIVFVFHRDWMYKH